MAIPRSIDLLPEIFQTDTNKQFLSATLDQLTQEPVFNRAYGYIGRRAGPGVNPADGYLAAPTATRSDYQLEPGVTFQNPDTNRVNDAITYPGMLDALNLKGAVTTKEDVLFESQYYTWDPFCDLDKFTNYSQYYWLANGPAPVNVFGSPVPETDSWDVTRTDIAYQFSDVAGNNPTITLVRGGSYQFNVNQVGYNFWIQASPGISGTMPNTPNISSRTVLGVDNNGEDQGTVTFNVPLKGAQNFYYQLANAGTVDLITDLQFTQLNNVYVDQFFAANPTGIDGITNLNNRTVIFTNTIADAQDGGWQITSQFDPLPRLDADNGLYGSFDTLLYDQTTDITDPQQRYSVWQIQYINDESGNPYMRLSSIRQIANLSKFNINFGTQWASTTWYKDASGYFEEVPLLTAVMDNLWYQDSVNPGIFGQIQLVDDGQSVPINVNDIIGAKNYISPNGVVFTNGLKVQFRGLVNPPEFQDLEYYVEGVGTGLGTDLRVGFVDGVAYFGPSHWYAGRLLTGAVHSTTTFQQYIYATVAESLANPGAGAPEGYPLPEQGFFGATFGTGIRLLPVSDFVTPETYTVSSTIPYDSTSYDSQPYDASLNAPRVPDYITINRASQDRNAWTRSNRWFHTDVIKATAVYNNQVLNLNNNLRANRPIIEFRADIKLFDFGTQGKNPVNIIDFTVTDAFNQINGQLGYSLDGYNLINGSRIIFAADTDPAVRNHIYVVQFIDPDNSGTLIIDLIPAIDSTVLTDQTVVCLDGNTLQGISFWYDGSIWIEAQQKEHVNQAPLFDVYDSKGIGFGDRIAYPSSTFRGSRLFGYAFNAQGSNDTVLGFPLKYRSIDNLGDIVFQNYLYTDTFIYVVNNTSQTLNISTGFAREYATRIDFSDLIGWQTAVVENRSRQVFRFDYVVGTPLILDIAINTLSVLAPLQIFIGGIFVEPTKYVYEVGTNSTTITIIDPAVTTGTIIEVLALSEQTSAVGFYQVPLNLENNPLNNNSDTFTLGTIRTHYQSIGENLRTIEGPIVGANNTRDLGDILIYGQTIVQNSAPLTLTGVFLREKQFELFNSLEFNSRSYSNYKAYMMNLATEGDYQNSTIPEILNSVIAQINLGNSSISPFYWSDMVPSNATYISNSYTYTPISTPTFNTVQFYNFTKSNYQGLLIYLNDRLLTINYDYTVATDAATVTILTPLVVGDVIVINEYPETFGNYVPNTPTKMGLYPAFKPEIYLDTTYLEPKLVIRGHDGSITLAFGDYRDQVLLEFETRIFNNLKIQSAIPLVAADVIPGQFRTTDYSLADINQILGQDFLTWVGWNKLDYITQTYINSEPFTYNYNQSSDRLTGQPISQGFWRGIYNYFYDTYYPDTRPWEMLGFSQQPTWWAAEYGPAPYTSGNTVLWDDLANGLVRDPNGIYVEAKYARPGLLQVLPVGTEGELLDPLLATVGNYIYTSFKRSWVFGDGAPVENTWKTSSSYPFAIMRLLALTKPGKFFSLFADRDRYVYDSMLDQYLWDERYRLDANKLTPLYGNDTSKASYLNWIIDYNRQLGINSTDNLTVTLNNVDVRLCWRVGGYTDQSYLTIQSERSTPDSLNTTLTIPDESYQIVLYKNQPFKKITFSSVVVQNTEAGWSVFGYNTQHPYFEILASRNTGNYTTISAGNTQVQISLDHTDTVVRIPYGYVFSNASAVCDFLYSYGVLLEQNGLIFDTMENGYVLTWLQMAQEFLYWNNQGWQVGSIINLNPGATKISVTNPTAIVDNINDYGPENIILNQNRQPFPKSDLVINRIGNSFEVMSLTSNTINYLNLQYTAYEHIVVFDNVSVFSDLIYDPTTGARQSRLLVNGYITGDWTGLVNAPGFVINSNNVAEWIPNYQYTKGEIVLYKNEYWSADDIIQPSATFNFAQWIKSNYRAIQTGLRPNASNQSVQLAQSYSVYDANLDSQMDLFSYGLIGFRPRDYMSSLNLDSVTQVNLYQQFLKNIGTRQAAQLFSLANISNKEVAEYKIYEFWAILRGTYGATANQSFVEVLLNQAQLTNNPSTVQVITPGERSPADQPVLLENLWRVSDPNVTTDFMPTIDNPPASVGLPSAGYVNVNDVDLTAFTISDVESSATLVKDIGIGTTIWVAKVNNYNWGVYRAQQVPGKITQVTYNLNGLSLVQFSQPHGLSVGDILVIKFLDPTIDGIYTVQTIIGITSLLIKYTFSGLQTTVTGNGLGLTLKTTRVSQAANVSLLPVANQLVPGAKVWVDNNGSGNWEVIEKTEPFTEIEDLAPLEQYPDAKFGSALGQGLYNLSALIGAPGYNSESAGTAPGAVFTYVKTSQDIYKENSVLQLGTTDAAGYGNAIHIGSYEWAVAGASASENNAGYASIIYRNQASNAFQQWQLLCIPSVDRITATDEFGYAVSISLDEQWIFVGAPGANLVYVYGKVPYQAQYFVWPHDGTTNLCYYPDQIVVANGTQLVVAANETILVLGVDYEVSGDYISFNTPPLHDTVITVARRTSDLFVGDGSTDTFDVSNIYTATSEYNTAVYINDSLQRPGIDYIIDSENQNLIFDSAPADQTLIQVRAETYYTLVDTLTASGLTGTDRFGHSIVSTTDGSQIYIGCPNETYIDPVTSEVKYSAGSVYIFNRSNQSFFITDATQTEFTCEQSLVAPTQVTLNGVVLLATENNIGGNYSIDTNTIILNSTVTLTVGDTLTVETNTFSQVQKLRAQTPAANAKFGWNVDECPQNCSLYIGAPYANSPTNPSIIQSGQVEFCMNQGRGFGLLTTTVANPTLTSTDYLSISGYFVQVGGTTVNDLAASINAAGLPNIQAAVTADLELYADGSTRIFDIGSIYSAASAYTPVVLVDSITQTLSVDYTYNNSTEQITFTVAPLINSIITVVSGQLTISVINQSAALRNNKIQVLPAVGTVFDDIGITVYLSMQVVVSPVEQSFANFGKEVYISTNATTLSVGAPNGTAIEFMTFDHNTTTFDANSIKFYDTVPQSGVVYTYDQLPSVNSSIYNPPQFVFGQQLYDDQAETLAGWGTAIDFTTGTLLIGSPNKTVVADDRGIVDPTSIQNGWVTRYRNTQNLPAWATIREQTPVVDVSLLSTVYMYNRVTGGARDYFDYFDPLQGRLLGIVAQNIDYIGSVDPAAYNTGNRNNYGNAWRADHVGRIWWNTSNARFVDPNQNDVEYALRRWGQLFPGSTVDVYQWVSSSVPPAQYTGPGTPYDTTSYVVSSSLNLQGVIGLEYYFWVIGINTVSQNAQKTLSSTVIAQYIESPVSSGISYIAPINASTVAIYNGVNYVSAQDTILYVGYNQVANDGAVHVEYQLVPQGRPDGFLTDQLYLKLQDSFCGADPLGNSVPDPHLNIGEQFGVEFRPRQSMFVNRFAALQNYLVRANTVLAQFPISETRSFNLLNSREPVPSIGSGAWDKEVANIEELSYQNLASVPFGYTYLVLSDSNYNGIWTIYQVSPADLLGAKELVLMRVQSYDTHLYWNYINWYQPGYNRATPVAQTVADYSILATLSVANTTVVKVSANSKGFWELYQYNSTTTAWTRVALENGTIEFSKVLWDYAVGSFGFDSEVFDAQFYDQAPITETRKIIQAINEELFVGDLLIERNNNLILMFNYILSEQQAPTWLSKTSLIDVDHTIRQLLPYPIYRKDNQDFVLNYINEVKPYHVQFRQFNLIYNGIDSYLGTLTDFDLPAYYDSAESMYISPVLDDTGTLSTTSSVPSTSTVWQTVPWNQWYQNYLLSINSVSIVSGGEGYTVAPTITVVGTAIRPAVMTAIVNSAGNVIRITVDDPGEGYSTTAQIVFEGGNGTGAIAVAVMGNGLVREFKTTIKYDRYEYSSNIVEWQANVTYVTGTQVRYADTVWSAITDVNSTAFDTDQWTVVPASTLSGVNRTQGYYAPTPDQPGLDLAQLISGIDYPGVQVQAPSFNQNTGFDVGNYDINPFDNISYDADGSVTYDPAILDTIFESSFLDPYLGVGPTAINIDGGAFVDTYSSHAPEELVPGAIFDTLDMRVYTTPGADWQGLGHGFPLSSIKYAYNSGTTDYSFAGVIDHPFAVRVWNQTNRVQLDAIVHYSVDWVAQTITINSGATNSDVLVITAYGLGGGNQMYINSYNGADVGNSIIVPIAYSLISEMVVFVNGTQTTDFDLSAASVTTSEITFGDTYGINDYIAITALGYAATGTTYSWSLPLTQYIVYDGSDTYTLTNSLEGTNPANIIVEQNGVRARPSEGIEYIGDDVTTVYSLPANGGYSPALVSNNDVSVYIDNQALIYGVDFTLDAWDTVSAARTITFATAPALAARILISVRTAAQYYIEADTIVWNSGGSLHPGIGDIISVTTWNDTAEQRLITEVFVGPTTTGVEVTQGYDDTNFDEGNVTGELGSFSYGGGGVITSNNFDLGREIINPSSLSVTMDGLALFNDIGFTVSGSTLTILGPIIDAAVCIVVTVMTQSVVPEAMEFRIFQDMRGAQTTYRMTPATTTTLTQSLSPTDDVIYVADANALSEPDLVHGIFGLITINGERIAYRERNTVDNTVSGLRRGTAGTGAASHDTGSEIYDIGIGNVLPVEYQNYANFENFLANGTDVVFTTTNVTVPSGPDTAVLVYVGGTLQTSGYTVSATDPVVVTFDTAPTENYQVTILVEKGLSWYNPGSGTASDGVPLQEQTTLAARFIRGS